MSAVLIRREIPAVAVTAEEAGREFADASADVQCAFLNGMVEAAKKWCWPMQCRYIVDELSAEERSSIANLLDTLLEHLREPVENAA